MLIVAKKNTKKLREGDPVARNDVQAAAAKNIWLVEYKKYFTPPLMTPGAFQILDLSSGGSTTVSSHS